LYDAANDRYLVANINGAPLDVDDNGFIAVLGPDGKAVAGKWIDGAAADVTLNAPKGMAIVGGTLWGRRHRSRPQVRSRDRQAGRRGQARRRGVPERRRRRARRLDRRVRHWGRQDVRVDRRRRDLPDRRRRQGHAGDQGQGPGQPQRRHVTADGTIWVATFGSGELYAIDPAGAKQPGQKLPKGQLDGIVALPGGDLLVTSWEGSAVYRGKPGGEWKAIAENLKAPADLGYDSKRGWMLVPLFMDNGVHAAAVP
jgi:hypothetical protein